MSDTTITALSPASGIDGAVDWLAIDRTSPGATQRINRQTFLGVTGQPMDISSSQNVTNKTLDNTNIITLKDTLFTLQDDGDTTKQAKFQLSGITTATTRTYTLPNASSTLVDLSTAQTLTTKTLTAPTIVNGSITGTTITTDAIVGQSAATNGTIYGVSISGGTIGASGLATNSVTTAKIAVGAVTSAKVTLSYGFSAYSTTAQNTGNGAFALTNFQLEEYDIGSNFASSTFTAPVTAYYHFDAHVSTTGTPTIFIISFFKNGTELKRGNDIRYSAAVVGGNASVTIRLAATDTLDVRAFGSSAVAIDVTQATCYFMGYFIGN